MMTTAQSSRRRLAAMLFALASIHAVAVLTSEIEPGTAQFRVGADSTVGGLLAPGLPPGLLLIAVVAALALGCAALAVGAGTGPALQSDRSVAPAALGRRRLLLGAGGGAAALALAAAFRGRLAPDADPLVQAASADVPDALAVASAPVPPSLVGSSAATVADGPPVGGPVAVAPATAGAPVPAAPTDVISFGAPASSSVATAPPPAASAPAVVADPPAAALVVPPAAAAEAYPPVPVASAPAPVAVASQPTPAAVASQPTPAPAARMAAPAAPRRPSQTMPGGRNNYVPGAPLVKNLGTGFVVSGTVLDAATGQPVRDTRIQIWLNTARGGEALASNRGSVLTDQSGRYRLDTSPVVPQFGQPHVHIAYDDGEYDTLFLRPVLKSERDTSITVDFILGSSAA